MEKTINVGNKKVVLVTYNTNNIKTRCFICGGDLFIGKNTPEEYCEQNGNCCHACSARASRVVGLEAQIERKLTRLKALISGKAKRNGQLMTPEERKAEQKWVGLDVQSLRRELSKIL
jgi:hypothetical protein